MKAKIIKNLHVVSVEMIDNSFATFIAAMENLSAEYGTRKILYCFTVDQNPVTKIIIIFE